MAIHQQKDLVDLLLQTAEPDHKVLENDLRHLAAYLVKIGTNITIAGRGYRRKRLYKHPELNADLIDKLINKYKLTWSRDCEWVDFDIRKNRSLHHVAHCYPNLFLETAATMTPGGYEERRFWWCANNYKFYVNNSPNFKKYDKVHQIRFSTSRLVSDVLCHFLNITDHKLIAISALHLSVKYSDSQVFPAWYERNKTWICEQIKRNDFGKRNPELKKQLRVLYRIKEAEEELETVHVDFFIEWWNLTGLRRPTKKHNSTREATSCSPE